MYLTLCNKTCNDKGIPRSDQLWIDMKRKPLSKLLMRSWFRTIICKADPSAYFESIKIHSMRRQVASSLDARGIPLKKSLTHSKKFYNKWNIKENHSAVLAGMLPADTDLIENNYRRETLEFWKLHKI